MYTIFEIMLRVFNKNQLIGFHIEYNVEFYPAYPKYFTCVCYNLKLSKLSK